MTSLRRRLLGTVCLLLLLALLPPPVLYHRLAIPIAAVGPYPHHLSHEAAAAAIASPSISAPTSAATGTATDKVGEAGILCCTCPTAPHCHVRRNGTGTPPGPPRPYFGGKVWYFTMGSAQYIWALELYVRGLTNVGVGRENIGLVCIDDVCAEHFRTNWEGLRLEYFGPERIAGTKCEANARVSDVRCTVSMGKIDTMLRVLGEGDAIFFFDADVLFFEHPYEAMRVSNPNLPLYAQSEGGSMNFGVLLAYPDPFTVSLFEHTRAQFEKTQAFDQGIFNRYLKRHKNQLTAENRTDCLGICGDPFDYERLRPKEYISLMTGRYDENNRREHVLAHATCVEGAVLPQMAMRTIFGNHANSSYYRTYKTVMVDSALDGAMVESIDRSMRVLVYVAKHTGRAIRIESRETSRMIFRMNWFRLVSANYVVGELGLDMVEDRYYERAHEWFDRPGPVVVNVTLGADTREAISRLRHIVSSSAVSDRQSSYNAADEIVFHVSELVRLDGDLLGELAGKELGYGDGKWRRPFTCRSIEREVARCVQVCDGGHFR